MVKIIIIKIRKIDNKLGKIFMIYKKGQIFLVYIEFLNIN